MSAPTAFTVQGWCPGALRPMRSGDGLVVRVRPNAGRLTQDQTRVIAQSARDFGNGLIDLSARANLQLRGVSDETHPPLIAALRDAGLVDADIASEARRNLLVTPFADASTDALAGDLALALADGPDLPSKFGFAVDTGARPVLQTASADIRLERDVSGGIILRCDGAALGAPVAAEKAARAAVDLAHWFIAAGGVTEGRGRMSALVAAGVLPEGRFAGQTAPAAPAPRPAPGLIAEGGLFGLAFGQMGHETLAALADLGDLRLTPWRMVLIEGLSRLPNLPGLILDPSDPSLQVSACTGAPGCLQGLRPVRGLAARLAASLPAGKSLHVSGCAKGCAHPFPADFTLIATEAGFDLVLGGTAQDTPSRSCLSESSFDLKDLT